MTLSAGRLDEAYSCFCQISSAGCVAHLMREDMCKLLVERPRLGGGMKFQRNAERKWQRIAIEERPRSEAIKARWRQSKVQPKSLNENLAPLLRFLRHQVGRPWNEVYSEICQRINRDSAVQLHIWQHVMQMVEVDPRRVALLKSRAEIMPVRGRMYVDSQSGRLCELFSPITKRDLSARRNPPPWITTVAGRFYGQIRGLWYEIELASLPVGPLPAWDIILRKPTSRISYRELYEAYGRNSYAAGKRQLRSKEVAKLTAAIAKCGKTDL